MWKEYFSNAEIYGADIDKNVLFFENRIKTYHVDQLDEKRSEKCGDRLIKKNLI